LNDLVSFEEHVGTGSFAGGCPLIHAKGFVVLDA